MNRLGECHCGSVRYEVAGEAVYQALCHCAACRGSSGAPMVGWFCVAEQQLVRLDGELAQFEGTPGAARQFCPRCGTGLFYRNQAMLPGLVDIQSATFDEPGDLVPAMQVQCAERLAWLTMLDQIPQFERYPGPTP
jgi:hypothetical protein